jgi:polysaccharide pyruvyl transferase WcaK-like protein
LLGADADVHVTIDTALGADVSPLPRSDWPGSPPAEGRHIVAVCVIDGKYPDEPDADAARHRHDDAVIRALTQLATRCAPAHVVFLPQVHGRHADAPYLRRLAAMLPPSVSREVLAEGVPSRVQQRIFAAADVVLAGRYHPAVFAILGEVPVACIAYEHKSIGLMEAAGMGNFAVPIETVTPESLVALVDKVVDAAPAIRQQLATIRPELQRRAQRTADLSVALLPGSATGDVR